MEPPAHISPTIPKAALPLAALSLGIMSFTAWNQSYWWTTLEDDHFGWLTPALVL